MSATPPAEFAPPVFLAPHYDDVALSCGGTVAALADAGLRPLIVTGFGGAPTGPLSDFARFQHERWGLAPGAVLDARREEEACAAGRLGAEHRWLDFPDAIYRGERYRSDPELFGELHPEDAGLADALCAAVEPLLGGSGSAPYFVPLAVGGHVDHRIASDVGRRLAQAGREVWAYEDFPYAGDPAGREALAERARAVSDGDPRTRLLAPEQLERRVQAVLCYRSQLAVIFRHQGDPAESTRAYARAVGDGVAAERFWPVRGTPTAAPR